MLTEHSLKGLQVLGIKVICINIVSIHKYIMITQTINTYILCLDVLSLFVLSYSSKQRNYVEMVGTAIVC